MPRVIHHRHRPAVQRLPDGTQEGPAGVGLAKGGQNDVMGWQRLGKGIARREPVVDQRHVAGLEQAFQRDVLGHITGRHQHQHAHRRRHLVGQFEHPLQHQRLLLHRKPRLALTETHHGGSQVHPQRRVVGPLASLGKQGLRYRQQGFTVDAQAQKGSETQIALPGSGPDDRRHRGTAAMKDDGPRLNHAQGAGAKRRSGRTPPGGPHDLRGTLAARRCEEQGNR